MSENETITVLLDECDEEGWVMGMNANGDKGFVPQNYVQMAGEGDTGAAQAQAQEQVTSDYNSYGMQRQDSYQSTSSYGSQPQSAGMDQGQGWVHLLGLAWFEI